MTTHCHHCNADIHESLPHGTSCTWCGHEWRGVANPEQAHRISSLWPLLVLLRVQIFFLLLGIALAVAAVVLG